MNKSTALILFILIFASAARAQESSPVKFFQRFELVAGGSFSKNNGYLPDYQSKAGYSFGLGYYQKLYRSLSLNLRSLYEMKGSAVRYSYWDGTSAILINDDITIQSKYLSYYLMPTFQFGRQKNIQIGAGGYYSFLQALSVKSNHTRSDTGAPVNQFKDSNNSNPDYFNHQHDAGVSFQIGYSFNLSDQSQLMLQVFSNRGLVDLYNGKIGSHRINTYGLQLSFRMR